MNKIVTQITGWIANIFFPQDSIEMQAQNVVANIARLKYDEGDTQVRYACPAYSFFAYRNMAVRAMIWKLKYRGDKTVAELFASKMHDQICEELTELVSWANFKNPILVAIPVSKHKLRIRGFNQSAAICMALAALDQNNFFTYTPNVLYKIKDTLSQARVKDRLSRLLNLKDSFTVKDKSLVHGRNIILLDDVLTTGSTLTEATLTLKNAGAKDIIWLVVAH